MSALIRAGELADDDTLRLADSDPLPDRGRVLLGLERWRSDSARLREQDRVEVGVVLANTVDVVQVFPEVSDRSLIALEFPSFADGRAYSQARLLRSRCGYRGELRATGKAVVRDQIGMMARVGFDSLALRSDQDPLACLQALQDFSLAYQPGEDRLPLVARLRAGLSSA